MTLGIAISLLALPFLLVASAFFSGSENALFSLSPLKLKRLFKAGQPAAPVISRLLDNPRRTLITILSGNMLVNISISTISAAIILHFFNRDYLKFSIALVTFFIVIFGEILPKTMAMHHNEKLAPLVARPIDRLAWLITPFRKIIQSLADFLTTPLTRAVVNKKFPLTSEALKTIVGIGFEEGHLLDWQKKIFEGYFDFNDKTVRELMIPRTEIFFLNITDSFEEVTHRIADQNFSRLPVIGNNSDEIKGVIYAKEIVKLKNRPAEEQQAWQKLLRPPQFVPESQKADELLKKLIAGGGHLAVVVDEYGGTLGLVTLEDLLESIFAEINPLRSQPKIKFLTPEVALISGNLEIGKFNRIFRTRIRDPYHQTMAGFISGNLDRIPRVLENLVWENFSFLILRASSQKIMEIQVRRLPPPKRKGFWTR